MSSHRDESYRGESFGSVYKLTFANFFEGSYEQVELIANGNSVPQDDKQDRRKGTFVFYSEVDAALKAINN